MEAIPQWIIYTIGTLIVANIGTIGSILLYGGKAVWWLSKLDSRVKEAQDTAVRAHKRIDTLTT